LDGEVPCRHLREPARTPVGQAYGVDLDQLADAITVPGGELVTCRATARGSDHHDAIDPECVQECRQRIPLLRERPPGRERCAEISRPARSDDPEAVDAQVLTRHETLVPPALRPVDGEDRLTVPPLCILDRALRRVDDAWDLRPGRAEVV